MQTVTRITPRQGVTAFIETGGQRVRYRVRGEGPPLLMLHGIGASLEYWSDFEARLEGVQTITVDPPGAGQSSTPPARFGMRQFAEVMNDLLVHLEIERAGVLGLSLGGMIAQELAHRHPERVDKLVLVSTTCGLGSIPANPKTLASIASPLRFYSSRRYKRFAPLMYGDRVTEDSPLLDEHMKIRRGTRPSVLGHYAQLRAATTWTSRPWLRQLTMPVLVIAGTADRVVPLGNARILASGVRNGRLELIEGGGHLCLLQEPERTSGLVREFLQAG